ncbi:hypothetical protein M378DRAFT_172240 [Amanita muscaria Koide BX008]|uniref:Uncharacterized protein n=1 Tax=Amanita muscaria (strain Koide BX008) TaxID=946122 RepID=A0A0C2S311_AMAMK|nr:hypothetical protein M378DRAFT_172240 [Amanita muscaria Koide BX008]
MSRMTSDNIRRQLPNRAQAASRGVTLPFTAPIVCSQPRSGSATSALVISHVFTLRVPRN